jgi:hypothetical protein
MNTRPFWIVLDAPAGVRKSAVLRADTADAVVDLASQSARRRTCRTREGVSGRT